MIYLTGFELLNEDTEYSIIMGEQRNIYNNYYPLKLFPQKKISKIEFDPITIFYGGNGSGKSTLLNIIACKIGALRKNDIDKGVFFNNYVDKTYCDFSKHPQIIKIITSEDVFDYMLDLQAINSKVNRRKDELVEEYLSMKYQSSSKFYDDYEQLKNKVLANKKTMSAYVRERLSTNNIITQSNGETALSYWENEISENAIYILDEPENSLSAQNQLKLKKFIEESTRFYNCQFIIATHSPFILSLFNAKIYDLDSVPVDVKKWYELENVKVHYEFFKDNKNQFE